MTKPIKTESIEKATGISWSEWVVELNKDGARNLSHSELADLVKNKLQGKIASHEWWAQSITVAYEQHIGKRVPGQLANGKFEIAISKTVHTSRDDLFPTVVDWLESQNQLDGQDFTKPRSSQTLKRSNWRCDLADGSKFTASIEDAGDKSKLVLSQTDIPTKPEADSWKSFWKTTIDRFVR